MLRPANVAVFAVFLVGACSLVNQPEALKLSADAGGSAGKASAGTSSTTGGANASAGSSMSGGGTDSMTPNAGAGAVCDSCGGDAGAPGTTPICVPNVPGCDGNIATKCNADGTAYLESKPCATTETCVGGECKKQECEPKSKFCSVGVVRQCADDGLSSTEVETCPDKTYCDAASATCKQGVCAPNMPACDGTRATTCNADGSGYLATGTTCAAGTTCDGGECKKQICTPNKNFCVGGVAGTVKACADNGLSSSDVQTCGAAQYCDAPSATCKDQVCSPGKYTCDNTTLQKCNALGSASVNTVCSGNTPVCDADQGKCIPCGANTQSCSGKCVSVNDQNNCGSCGVACSNTQTCKSAECLTKDGYDCVNSDECASGVCNTYYADQDGDTHGAPGSPKQTCGITPPAGYVTSKDDCCDVGADAGNIFKGQTKWFTSAATSCGKGWDYDCSNNIEQEVTNAVCEPAVGSGACPSGPFWASASNTVPGCGQMGSKENCIDIGAAYCATSPPQTATQGCH